MTTAQRDETHAPGRYADVNGVHLYHETHGAGRPMA